MTKISMTVQEKEVRREIAMRMAVYPSQIKRGEMTEAEAAHRIAVLEAALQTLQEESEPFFI